MTEQFIYLDPFIQEEQNTEISVLQSNTIISYIEDNDNSILSTLQVSEAALEQTITAVSITSTSLVTLDNELEIFIGGNLIISVNSSLTFGDVNLDREIPNVVSIESALVGPEVNYVRYSQDIELLSDKIDIVKNVAISEYANEQIEGFQVDGAIQSTSLVTVDNELEIFLGGTGLISIPSTVIFSINQLDLNLVVPSIETTTTVEAVEVISNIDVDSITSTASFSQDHEVLNFVVLDSVEPTTAFGLSNFNLFLGLESIQEINTFDENVLVLYIGQEGTNLLEIEPTTSFGTPSFGGFVQRVLIFKDDNIAKIGTADAVEVVNGIVMNPSSLNSSSATAGQSTLPNNPEGFILVTINGTNYKIPYYNE